MNHLGPKAKASIMIKTTMKSISAVARYLELRSCSTHLKLEDGDSEA